MCYEYDILLPFFPLNSITESRDHRLIHHGPVESGCLDMPMFPFPNRMFDVWLCLEEEEEEE